MTKSLPIHRALVTAPITNTGIGLEARSLSERWKWVSGLQASGILESTSTKLKPRGLNQCRGTNPLPQFTPSILGLRPLSLRVEIGKSLVYRIWSTKDWKVVSLSTLPPAYRNWAPSHSFCFPTLHMNSQPGVTSSPGETPDMVDGDQEEAHNQTTGQWRNQRLYRKVGRWAKPIISNLWELGKDTTSVKQG